MTDAADPTDLVVLHGLRCMGFVSEQRLGEATGLAGAPRVLRSLEERGLVEHSAGPFGGWGLTGTGRLAGERLVAEDLARSGAEAAVRRCFATFLELNPVVLDICHDWQMRAGAGPPVMNNHQDEEYDAAVIDRLLRLDDEAQRLCVDLGQHLPRFGRYGTRLVAALGRVMAGDTGAFADDVESYHAIWFHFHEDLLVTLGERRFN